MTYLLFWILMLSFLLDGVKSLGAVLLLCHNSSSWVAFLCFCLNLVFYEKQYLVIELFKALFSSRSIWKFGFCWFSKFISHAWPRITRMSLKKGANIYHNFPLPGLDSCSLFKLSSFLLFASNLLICCSTKISFVSNSPSNDTNTNRKILCVNFIWKTINLLCCLTLLVWTLFTLLFSVWARIF